MAGTALPFEAPGASIARARALRMPVDSAALRSVRAMCKAASARRRHMATVLLNVALVAVFAGLVTAVVLSRHRPPRAARAARVPH